jgi:hypothetical protein
MIPVEGEISNEPKLQKQAKLANYLNVRLTSFPAMVFMAVIKKNLTSQSHLKEM